MSRCGYCLREVSDQVDTVIMCSLNDIHMLMATCYVYVQKKNKRNLAASFWTVIHELISLIICARPPEEFSEIA